MKLDRLSAISPVDGRYLDQVKELQPLISEFGLIRHRLFIEIRWLEMLSQTPSLKEIPRLDAQTKKNLEKIIAHFSKKEAEAIKVIEKDTHHDIKAIEIFIRQQLSKKKSLRHLKAFVHFGCTSDDINNLAYALIIKQIRDQHLLPLIQKIKQTLKNFAKHFAEIPMLARTHGQPATPTTLGKEFAVFLSRLNQQHLDKIKIKAKFNGATGNYSAHTFAYPDIKWENVCRQFIEGLNLCWNGMTTQIEPHDYIAELCHIVIRINNILIDMTRDIWLYISMNYFQQKHRKIQVGSSTMPHKINPIDFENAEGNLALSNALLNHFANHLPISRLQRDLTDSTTLRNLGIAFAHTMIAYQSILKGLNKLIPNKNRIKEDLENHWELLTEPLQTLMRRYGIENAYDQLKKLSRGKKIDKKILHQFVDSIALPEDEKNRFKKLTPLNYIGKANQLAKKV